VNLWDRLRHQGTTTAGSCTALPELLSSALRYQPGPCIAPCSERVPPAGAAAAPRRARTGSVQVVAVFGLLGRCPCPCRSG